MSLVHSLATFAGGFQSSIGVRATFSRGGGKPFAQKTSREFHKTSAKQGCMFLETFIARAFFPKASQFCHFGILARNRACNQ